MAGSTWGTLLTMTTWGESHGKGVGVVVDGCPAGLALCEEDIQTYLNRRKPGQSRFTTMRQESDQVEILSGVFEGKTTGTPISLLVRNTDQRSHDYSSIMDIYRPGHADCTFDESTDSAITGRRTILRPGDHRACGSRSDCGKAAGEPWSDGDSICQIHRTGGDLHGTV